MGIEQLVFYAFSTLLILSAIAVVTVRNSVRAVLFLIVCFFSAAAIWLLLEAEFLAISLILVYVGAVMVLFLFVVMMLDIDYASLKQGFTKYLPIGLLGVVVFFGGVYGLVNSGLFNHNSMPIPAPHASDYSNIHELGMLLYTHYFYPFEIAAVLLLVAIIAAISLTFRGSRERKVQNVSEQVKATKASRLRVLKMDTEIYAESIDESSSDSVDNKE